MEASEVINTDNIDELTSQPYTEASLNLSEPEFRNSILLTSKHTILEIGCGIHPRMSWNLDQGDAWIGCDPGISESTPTILVHTGENTVSPTSKLAVFSSPVESIPVFKPNVLISVAPNPKDITEGEIFNDDLKRFLDTQKRQYFVVSLDSRTVEAEGYRDEAKNAVLEWMNENGFIRIQQNQILEKFESNSEDVEAENEPMFFARNSSLSRK